MTNAKSYNINLFNKLSLSSFLHLLISLHLSSNNSHCNSHSLHACFRTCTLSIVGSEQKHHRASSCCPVSLKYWTNPNRRSKILVSQSVAERDVATYLLHVKQHIYYTSFWEQHICKSYSRCLSPLIPASITWAGPRCVQELATILAPQNRIQGRCDTNLFEFLDEI